MNVDRGAIERVFGGPPFPFALFYARPGGLRFELSEGPDAVSQFLSALRKSQAICDSVFAEEASVGVCLAAFAWGSRFMLRPGLRALRSAGIRVPRGRSLWIETEEDDDVDGEPRHRCFVAFAMPRALLQNALWCALASNLGVEPDPCCRVYLFSLAQGVLVHPYDDRGMDVVGDHETLAALYVKHDGWLLDYDRERMAQTFGPRDAAVPLP